jgi:hypothetical protein
MRIFTARRALLISLLSVAGPIAVSACGYPTFSFETSGTGSTGTAITGASASSGSGGSAAGTGGDVGASTSAATTGAATTGTGGGAPACTIAHAGGQGTCEYLPGKECGCSEPGQKCSVPDLKQTTGASECVSASTTPKKTWDACDDDSDCAAGVWCDHALHTCKPICITTDQCPSGAHCMPVPVDGTAKMIPGLKVCTAHCDPPSASPCGTGTTCYYVDATSEFDCLRSGNTVAGGMCKFADDCGKGLVCLGSGATGTCERWCSPANNIFSVGCALADPNKPYCDKFGMNATYNGVVYGVCDP